MQMPFTLQDFVSKWKRVTAREKQIGVADFSFVTALKELWGLDEH
jgi:hypothetical protein